MGRKRLLSAILVMLACAACGPKRTTVTPAPPPPPAKQNIIALLPEPEGGAGAIVVRNQAGSQDLNQAYQAVRVERADVAPSAPYPIDAAEARRLFGPALDALPAPEAQFVLHFDEGRDVLNAESQALLPAILEAVRDRHSTDITVIGHTDTVDTPQFNYQLGLRRAQNVAAILRSQGVNDADLFVASHGDTDLLVKTGRGVAEARNRRVEVIVR